MKNDAVLRLFHHFQTLIILSVPCLWMHASGAQSRRLDLAVEDPRPVAKAIESLISAYPVVITYEDPEYRYSGDTRDVATEVRRDLYRFQNSSVPKMLVPITRPLSVSVEIPETDQAGEWTAPILAILESQTRNVGGGRFGLVVDGDAYHVVPMETLDSSGAWASQGSILDALITIRPSGFDGYGMLRAICDEVAKATGVAVVVGTIPDNLFANYYGELEAEQETARAVLLGALREVNDRLTWRLLYAPGQGYALNIRLVPESREHTLLIPQDVGNRRPVNALRPAADAPSPFITPENRERAQRGEVPPNTDDRSER